MKIQILSCRCVLRLTGLIFVIASLSSISEGAFAKQAPQKVTISVTDKGFEPKSVDVKPGTDVILEVTRKSESTCATKIQIPSQKVLRDLPMNQMVSIALGVVKKGEIRFGCAENMMESAKIVVH